MTDLSAESTAARGRSPVGDAFLLLLLLRFWFQTAAGLHYCHLPVFLMDTLIRCIKAIIYMFPGIMDHLPDDN